MAYFDCIVGGSGKGNTVTVTCAEEFAGLTITLAKTGKTYTKTCPSTAPYVVTFYGVENGTYTVSCTVDGQTYSETVIVQDISCVLNYGFNWKIWVDTASQLDLSDYDSLDEVLADEEALRELFLEHACVDYMASVVASNEDLETIINDDYCAKWINLSDYALDYLYANEIIADLMDEADKYFYGEWVITDSTTTPPTWGSKGNVPLMTSNTAPYGTVVSNLTDGYKAFDGNDSTVTQASTENIYPYVEYDFTNPICLKKVFVKARTTTAAPSAFACKIQYYDDSLAAWSDLASFNIGISSAAQDYNIDTSSNDKYALKLRIYSTTQKKSGYGIVITTLQFYGRELKVSVPVMTSNTAPYGEASVLNAYSADFAAWKAFDNSTSTRAICLAMPNASNGYGGIGYKFTNKTAIKMVRLLNYGQEFISGSRTFYVQGSNDGTNWENVVEHSFTQVANVWETVDASENSDSYIYYRLYGNPLNYGNGNYHFSFTELQFYGLDYSEKGFEVGTTKKWLYDHGLELVSLTKYTSGAGAIAQNQNDALTVGVGSGGGSSSYGNAHFSIDFTPYSLMRGKVTGAIINSICGGFSISNGTNYPDTHLAVANFNSTYLPNGLSLDISNVNETSKGFAFSQTAANRVMNIAEWWLE